MSKSLVLALEIGAAILLILAIIGIAVGLFNPATEASKTATTEFSTTTTELKDQKYLQYDGTSVSGSTVVNALRKFEQDGKAKNIGIKVSTNKSTNWYYNQFAGDVLSSAADPSNVSETTSTNYVNPSGIFNASIVRDTNLVIRAIVFEQN
ncbi:hypothetical protein MHH81_21060 [Psychrobacillus sp. FSL H8-0484]|uniref:hypothetical protein n=1 Tax=Psychrobacillus sp. FSL H8-0484 TaxID=2921390 RepID=UPI0030F5C582